MAEARGRYADETKEPPLGAQGSFTRATQLLRRNGPGDGVEAEKLLLPILDGDADAALKGRACYALGYRHENAGRDKEGEEWLEKAAAFGDAYIDPYVPVCATTPPANPRASVASSSVCHESRRPPPGPAALRRSIAQDCPSPSSRRDVARSNGALAASAALSAK